MDKPFGFTPLGGSDLRYSEPGRSSPSGNRGTGPVQGPDDDSDGGFGAGHDALDAAEDEERIERVREHFFVAPPIVSSDIPDLLSPLDAPSAHAMAAFPHMEDSLDPVSFDDDDRDLGSGEAAPPILLRMPDAGPAPVRPLALEAPAIDPEPITEPMPRRLTPIEILTRRAVRPKSALDAARDAASREAASRESPPRAAEVRTPRTARPAAADLVRAIVAADLGGGAQVYVLDIQPVAAREVLRALWRGHRAKFLSDGNLERATAAASVVRALEQTSELSVARVVSRGQEHVAVVDLGNRRVVACLADAHALAVLDRSESRRHA